ncbi:MAG: CHRD domain-containing protein [Alphaproteobacteria bacterium]|nr:CHRD domain-containing protein [Alphaproteobacteria bacterium]
MIGIVSRRAVFALAGLACIAWAGSATAAPMKFKVPLTGAGEVPAVQTAGKATADLTWDASTRVVTWRITYSGLSSAATMAHFHNGATGANGPVTIWLTKKGSPVKSPITGKATLSPEQAQQFEAGGWYINVHSKDHPAGEIRGQVTPPKG